MTLFKKLGWANLAVFAAALMVGVIGILGTPAWTSPEQLTFGLLTLLVALICLVYFRQAETLDKRFENLGAAPLEAILKARREWLETGGIVSFESLKRPGVEVYVVGLSCIHFLSENEADLREAVQHGAKLRFVLVDPAVNFLSLYDVGMPNQSRAAALKDDIQRALEKIQCLGEERNVEYRLYAGVPMFSALWVRDRSNGKIFVEFYTYGGAPANRPGFFARRDESTKWYDFFVRSLETLWDASHAAQTSQDFSP